MTGGHAAIYCILCVGLPHCQHSAATLLFSCTVTWTPSVYKMVYSNVFVLLRQNIGTAEWRGEKIEAYKNGVWCEVFSVENRNGKNI